VKPRVDLAVRAVDGAVLHRRLDRRRHRADRPAGLEAFYAKDRPALAGALPAAPADKEPRGSNGIAIAPANSEDGHALLLINPHTSFFFRSELQVTSDEGLNAYGAATWGQFFIYQGFNAHAGWMHTSSGVDSVDEFLETIVERGGHYFYKYGERTAPVRTSTVTVPYRSADGRTAGRTFTIYRTHHGPIVRAEGGKWVAFAMMHKPIEALEQSFLRTKAGDYASFLKVAALQANSSNNTLFADDKGEIAYLHPQFIPPATTASIIRSRSTAAIPPPTGTGCFRSSGSRIC
jgi:acyl-homoserine-lactone acylase